MRALVHFNILFEKIDLAVKKIFTNSIRVFCAKEFGSSL